MIDSLKDIFAKQYLLQPGSCWKEHQHPHWQFNLYQKSVVVHYFGKSKVELANEEMLLISPGSVHAGEVVKAGAEVEYQMNWEADELPIDWPEEPYFLLPPNHPSYKLLKEILLRIIKEAKSESREAKLLTKIMLAEFILHFHQAIMTNTPEEDFATKQVRDTLSWAKSHIYQQFTLKELAEQAQMSPNHFGRVCKQLIGKSPLQYLSHLRIEEAKKLLQDSSRPLKNIAYALDFCDVYYFSRVFKKLTRKTPGEYRAPFTRVIVSPPTGG